MRSLLGRSLLLLHRRKVPEAENSIRILKEECFRNADIKVWGKNIKKFERLVKLRSWHYPVQYLCSSWPFRQLQLKLKKPVLIPRFESQYMIQILINKLIQKYQDQIPNLLFVEFGCGSGALGLSLAKQTSMKGTLIDIKDYCIDLTKLNATKNGIQENLLNFIQGDMMNNLDLVLNADIIISNPPYLSKQHYQKYLNTQIKKYQDRDALVTDKNGMKYVEALLEVWKTRTKTGVMMIEFDGRVLQGNLEWVEPFVVKDQYEKRRFILLEK